MPRLPDLVVVARIGLLLGAAALLAFGVALAVADRQVGGRQQISHVCPMHPEVQLTRAGSCPRCGMALVRVGDNGPEPGNPDSHRSSPDVLTLTVPYKSRGAHHRFGDRVTQLGVSSALHAAAVALDADHVDVKLHRDEITALAPDETGTLRLAGEATTIPLRRSASPPRPHDDSTLFVRFEVKAERAALRAGAELRPGTIGWVDLPPRPRQALVAPLHAVVESPEGPYVLVASPDNRTFTKRMVELGQSFSTYVVVLAGVRDGDRLATSDAFFVDSERRMRAGPAPERPAPPAPR